MSNIFAKYRKELSGVKVVSKKEAVLYSKTGKPFINPNYDIIGKVERDMPNVILKASRNGNKTAFIEDTSSLTKKTKSDLIDFFFNSKGTKSSKQTAFLVRTDNKSKTKPDIKQSLKKSKKQQNKAGY